jgi:hypothetical protein
MTERTYTADEVDAMIAKAVAATKSANTLHFAQWTNGEKDLSNYILVGHLTLAAIEDGEYGTSEIDPLDSTIDALQEHLITGDSKKVPLLAYIGGLNATTTAAQPAPVDRSGCSAGTDNECTNKACARACPALRTNTPKAQPTKPQVYGWVRMNGQFNSGVFHLGRECPTGWANAAEPVSLIVAADLNDGSEGGAA